jgi:hypothetical protein
MSRRLPSYLQTTGHVQLQPSMDRVQRQMWVRIGPAAQLPRVSGLRRPIAVVGGYDRNRPILATNSRIVSRWRMAAFGESSRSRAWPKSAIPDPEQPLAQKTGLIGPRAQWYRRRRVRGSGHGQLLRAIEASANLSRDRGLCRVRVVRAGASARSRRLRCSSAPTAQTDLGSCPIV